MPHKRELPNALFAFAKLTQGGCCQAPDGCGNDGRELCDVTSRNGRSVAEGGDFGRRRRNGCHAGGGKGYRRASGQAPARGERLSASTTLCFVRCLPLVMLSPSVFRCVTIVFFFFSFCSVQARIFLTDLGHHLQNIIEETMPICLDLVQFLYVRPRLFAVYSVSPVATPFFCLFPEQEEEKAWRKAQEERRIREEEAQRLERQAR